MSTKNKPSIDDLVAKMQRDKMPERDLWSGIEYSINASNVHDQSATKSRGLGQMPLYAIAASVFVVIFVSYFSFQTGRLESGQDLALQMSQQHHLQKDALLTSLQGQPATTKNWQQQLSELDEAAMAIKKALEHEPNNAALLKMLQKVYQQQITLIERVHAPAWHQI